MKRKDFLNAIASILENDGFVAEANDDVWRNAEYATASLIRSGGKLPTVNEIINEIRPYIRASAKVSTRQIRDMDGILIGVEMTQVEADKALEMGLAHYDTLGGLRAFTMDGNEKVLVEATVVKDEETEKIARSIHNSVTSALDEIAMLADGELSDDAFFEDEELDEAPARLICDVCDSGNIERIVEASYVYDVCIDCGDSYPVY